jgi:amino acid permease
MPSVVASLYHDLIPGSTPPAWALSGRVWITLLMAVLVPLCFMRHLHSLRHTSYVALFSVGACAWFVVCYVVLNGSHTAPVYLVLIVIVCYFYPLEGMPPKGEVHLIKFKSNFVATFPIQVFAFTCAQNVRTAVPSPATRG